MSIEHALRPDLLDDEVGIVAFLEKGDGLLDEGLFLRRKQDAVRLPVAHRAADADDVAVMRPELGCGRVLRLGPVLRARGIGIRLALRNATRHARTRLARG